MLFRSEGEIHTCKHGQKVNNNETTRTRHDRINIVRAQCTAVILFDFPSFVRQTSGKKEPLFESAQLLLNDSVDNRTQTKFFNHKTRSRITDSHASIRKLDLIYLPN